MAKLDIEINCEGALDYLSAEIERMADFIRAHPEHPFSEFVCSQGELAWSESVSVVSVWRAGTLNVVASPIGKLATILGEFNKLRDADGAVR